MQNPAVQRMLQDAVKWIAEPYNGASADDLKWNPAPAKEASQRLADITADLPPDQAALVVKQSMPTIQKIAGLEGHLSGPAGFTNLSKVVDSLGDTPEARDLTKQIAQAFRDQVNKWEGFFTDPFNGYIKGALNSGASPTLAVAVAAQLKADGKTRVADSVLHSVVNVIRDLQTKIKQDVSEYGELTKDLSWLIATSKDKTDTRADDEGHRCLCCQTGPGLAEQGERSRRSPDGGCEITHNRRRCARRCA